MTNIEQLALDASKCVSCGLCIPKCPTWLAEKNEASSPRGRIMIMAELARTNQASASAAKYLDSCLGCGICEDVCPSNVPYMNMLAVAKSYMSFERKITVRLVQWFVISSMRLKVMHLFIETAALLTKFKVDFLLPTNARVVAFIASAAKLKNIKNSNEAMSEVQLFEGCFGKALDKNEIQAAKVLLNKLGVKAQVPKNQGCCGAISYHAGSLEDAKVCEKVNSDAFKTDQPILSTATGCAAHLVNANSYGKNVQEAGFYINKNFNDKLTFKNNEKLDLIIHKPCSSCRLKDNSSWSKELLAKISNSNIIGAPENSICCGAGGITSMSYPETGDKLADRKLCAISKIASDNAVIVSSNYGCRMHLLKAIKRANSNLKIQGPLEIVASHLSSNNN